MAPDAAKASEVLAEPLGCESASPLELPHGCSIYFGLEAVIYLQVPDSLLSWFISPISLWFIGDISIVHGAIAHL